MNKKKFTLREWGIFVLGVIAIIFSNILIGANSFSEMLPIILGGVLMIALVAKLVEFFYKKVTKKEETNIIFVVVFLGLSLLFAIGSFV